LNPSELKAMLSANAAEISRLRSRIDETMRDRGTNAHGRAVWERACAEFHARYDELAFPGGYTDAHARIAGGDTPTIEAALCFLELRPYFFRSGYMYQQILRKIKRAPLSVGQSERLACVVARQALWAAQRVTRDQP
jgi:hypothetical protein